MADFRKQGLERSEAAKLLGYATGQSLNETLSCMRRTKNYMTSARAVRFEKAFGYNFDYLTRGQGELKSSSTNDKPARQNEKDTEFAIIATLTGIAETIIRMTGNKDAIDAWHAITNGDFSEYVEKLNHISKTNQNP